MKKLVWVVIVLSCIMLLAQPVWAFLEDNWPTYMGNQYLTGNNDGIIPQVSNVLW